MSYDVYLMIDTGGPEPYTFGDWNYTSNCAPMWREAGADLAEFHGKLAGECAPILEKAIDVMRREPERFKAMNPPNGWGDYDSVIDRLVYLVEMLEAHPKATVVVSR